MFDGRSCHRPRDLDNYQMGSANIGVCGEVRGDPGKWFTPRSAWEG